jgi:phage terminase Nu1 subunit (DNA packaging protein)
MIHNREEIQKILHISVNKLKQFERDGMPVVNRGRPYLYDYDDVINWLKNRSNNNE